MNIWTLDAETYFDKDFNLTKLTTEAYVRDARFEVHGWAIRYPNGKLDWQRDPPRACISDAVLGHHLHFDALILNHHYGITPKILLDTLSMSRLLLGTHVKHSLDGLRAHMGLPPKTTPYDLFKGKHWGELPPEVQKQIADGACDEVQSIWTIFNRFMAGDYS